MPDQNDDWDETVSAIPVEALSEDPPTHAYLVVMRGNNVGESFPINNESFVIGRGSGSDLRLHDEGVSRFHCKLYNEGGRIVVEDLNSRNGTFRNGERVVERRTLAEGDKLQVGTNYIFRFTYLAAPDARTPADSLEDPATGVLGRRRFMEELADQVAQAIPMSRSDITLPPRAGTATTSFVRTHLSLLLVHLDRSDEMSGGPHNLHLDSVIAEIATQLRGVVRPTDLIARIGSGDLAILVKRASPGDTFMLAERLRKQVHGESNGVRTLSIGIAAMTEINVESAHDFMVGAGSALHRARSQGGNRTVLCTPDLMRDPNNRVRV